MVTPVLSLLTLALPFLAAAVPNNHVSRATADCEQRGYDKGKVMAYFYSTDSKHLSLSRCGAHCLTDSQCVTYAYGGDTCLHYRTSLSSNFKASKSSPFLFSVRKCAGDSPASPSRGSASKSSRHGSQPSGSPPSTDPSTGPAGSVCGLPGYDKAVEAFKYTTKKAYRAFVGCKTLCLSTKRCVSFAIGDDACLLYTVSVTSNVRKDLGSPHVFYDVTCGEAPAVTSRATKTTSVRRPRTTTSSVRVTRSTSMVSSDSTFSTFSTSGPSSISSIFASSSSATSSKLSTASSSTLFSSSSTLSTISSTQLSSSSVLSSSSSLVISSSVLSSSSVSSSAFASSPLSSSVWRSSSALPSSLSSVLPSSSSSALPLSSSSALTSSSSYTLPSSSFSVVPSSSSSALLSSSLSALSSSSSSMLPSSSSSALPSSSSSALSSSTPTSSLSSVLSTASSSSASSLSSVLSTSSFIASSSSVLSASVSSASSSSLAPSTASSNSTSSFSLSSSLTFASSSSLVFSISSSSSSSSILSSSSAISTSTAITTSSASSFSSSVASTSFVLSTVSSTSSTLVSTSSVVSSVISSLQVSSSVSSSATPSQTSDACYGGVLAGQVNTLAGNLEQGPLVDLDDLSFELAFLNFPVQVFDVTTINFFMNSQGTVTLDFPSINSDNQNLYSSNLPDYAIVPYWYNSKLDAGKPRGMFYTLTGPAGARVLTLEWVVNNQFNSDEVTHFTVRLDEGNPGVFVYRYWVMSDITLQGTVGAQGGPNNWITTSDSRTGYQFIFNSNNYEYDYTTFDNSARCGY